MASSPNFETVARRAAARLTDIEPNLPTQVETELKQDPLENPTERFIDPISLAALIVSIASLGWTIYHDIKKDHADASAKTQALKQQLKDGQAAAGLPNIAPAQYDHILTVVATEIVQLADAAP